MNEDSHEAVMRDAQALAMELGVARAGRAVRGQPSPELDAAAERAHAVLLAAGERLNAEEFGRRVRARRRMDALRKRKAAQ